MWVLSIAKATFFRLLEMTIRQPKHRPIDQFVCDAEPGSATKLEVLASRWEKGVALFHPCDRRTGENRIYLEPSEPAFSRDEKYSDDFPVEAHEMKSRFRQTTVFLT